MERRWLHGLLVLILFQVLVVMGSRYASSATYWIWAEAVAVTAGAFDVWLWRRPDGWAYLNAKRRLERPDAR